MKHIKVTSRGQLNYIDRRGSKRYVADNSEFKILVIKPNTLYSDGKGAKKVQTHEQYLGIFQHGEGFVLSSEFKTID